MPRTTQLNKKASDTASTARNKSTDALVTSSIKNSVNLSAESTLRKAPDTVITASIKSTDPLVNSTIESLVILSAESTQSNKKRKVDDSDDSHDLDLDSFILLKGEKKYASLLDTYERKFMESFRKIQRTLKLQLSLVLNQKKNPLLTKLGLKCREHITSLLDELEKSSHEHYLFNESIDVPGDSDGHDLIGEAANMSYVLMRCNIGFHFDLNEEQDMVMIY
jgi:hypothetical protein